MDVFQLIVAVLAVWRLAHLVAREDGPFDLVFRLRRVAGDGFWGRLMDCPYCLSLWLAAAPAARLADDPAGGLLLWLAISGGACIVERVLLATDRATALSLNHFPGKE